MAVDIKQLRIGAHVLLTRQNKRVRIEGITKRKIGYHRRTDKTDHLAYARLNEIEPIEITSELLVELGFEVTGDWGEYKIYSKKNVAVRLVGECIYAKVEPNLGALYDVKYLHELENFIYLTLGKELIEE